MAGNLKISYPVAANSLAKAGNRLVAEFGLPANGKVWGHLWVLR